MFRAEVYVIKKVLGVNYVIAPSEKVDGPERVVHHNQVRPYVQRNEEERAVTRDNDLKRRPQRLGLDVTDATDNEIM